jgi:hypothetical protein
LRELGAEYGRQGRDVQVLRFRKKNKAQAIIIIGGVTLASRWL